MTTTEPLPAILDGLNPAQLAAVTHGEGPMLILAGPGSGKTRVITHRIAYLVRERRVPPWRILAVTFTNKAAKEMRERARHLLGDDAKDLAMGTFHSMCARWLRIDGRAIGISSDFTVYDDADQVALMKRIIEDLRVDPKRFQPRSVLSAISNAKGEMLTPAAFNGKVKSYFEEVVGRAFERYEQALSAASALDFDDLLTEAVRLFRESDETLEKYAGRYLHVLVDEFQDTNPAQYVLARQLASKNGNIAVVGDPDQSIYSWRAADIRNVRYFERDFPEHTTFLLEQNYRSTRPILKAAEAVIVKNPDRHERTLFTEREGGELVSVYEAYNEEEEGEYVSSEIARLVRSGSRHADIAVMYRTNGQSRPVEEALVRHRIPYRLIGGVRFYQRREIKDLVAYFRLFYNRLDEAALMRVINVPTRGIGDRTIERARAYANRHGQQLWDALEALALGVDVDGITGRSATAVRDFVMMIDGLRARVTGSLPDLLDAVLSATGYHDYLRQGDPDSDERLENVLQLRSVMGQYEEVGGEASDLGQFLQDVALISDVDEMTEGVDAVTLITLHTAKGLEFPVVFLVGMEEGLLPHIRSFDDPKQMEEERRLAYVGITRAKDALYLSRAYRRFTFGNASANPASRFLTDIPKNVQKPFGQASRSYIETAVAPPREEFRPAAAKWNAGDRVAHPKFGSGMVVSTQTNGNDVEIVVAFEGAGVKRLLQSFAPLTAAR